MKYVKKALALVLATLLLGMALVGCEIRMENNDTDTVVAVFEGENIYMDEAKLYVYTSQRQMEFSSQFMILYYYGGYDTFWDESWGYNLTQAMQELYQTKLLVKLAKDAGMTLTEEEIEKVEKGIENLKKDAAKSIEYAGATDEIIREFVEENALATKYYLDLVKDVDMTFDEATFHRKSLVGVSITSKSEKPAETVEDAGSEEAEAEDAEAEAEEAGAEEPETESEDAKTESEAEPESEEGEAEAETYSEEEKEANVREATAAILEMMRNGMAVSEIVSAYADSKTVNVTTLNSIEVSSEDAKADGEEEYTDYKQLAWDMSTGDIESLEITNSSDNRVGYVLSCENDDDPDLRKAAEDAELTSRREALFAERSVGLMKKYKTFHVYTEKVANIRYKGSILESITVTGDDFEAVEEGAGDEDAGESAEAE